MKKIFYFILSITTIVISFSNLNLKSYATSIEPQHNGFSNGRLAFDTMGGGNVYVIDYEITENSAYDRSGICCYYDGNFSEIYEQWVFITVKDLINGTYDDNTYFATATRSESRLDGSGDPIINNQTWVNRGQGYSIAVYFDGPGGMFTTDFPVFASQSTAIDYFRYGLLDEDSIRYGENYLEGMQNVEWEDGSPYYGSYSEDIPAPKWNVTGSQSGNIMKTITFTNAEYDPRAQDGRYGLVLSLKWGSVDNITLVRDGGLFSKNYKVYYGSTLDFGNMADIYIPPTRVGDILYCPQSFMFAQNTQSVSAFNSYLSNNPVANRTINVPSDMADTALSQTFENYLAKANCPYNTLIFTCCYYRQMDNGKFAFGPYSTGTFYPPSQGAVFSVGNLTTTDQGNMTDGNGGGSNGNSENGSWDQNWGNNTPDINYGQNVDPQELINNVQGLFGFVGQMPSFVAQLISFLPDWILSFIAVSLGLAIAIGVVKLFIG